MRQQLWLLNSSLLTIFLIALFISTLIRIEPPAVRIKRISQELAEKKKEALTPVNWEKIYKDDLFKTYVASADVAPSKKSLITPIPELQAPSITPPPEPKKQEFIAPLGIIVKGIIISSDDAKNVAMIEDETKKEGLYHVGDRVKDAQIIKISRNRVILLRGNGQQEIFFLRKDDPLLMLDEKDKWQYIIKKIDDNNFEIDPDHFRQEVETLGNLIERVGIVGTAYQQGKALGVRLGVLESEDLGTYLGLQKNDIITTINDMQTAEIKNRIKIYDAVTAMRVGDSIKVAVNREGQNRLLTYKLAKISTAKMKLFSGQSAAAAPEKKPEPLKTSPLQDREKQLREFKQRHQVNDSQQVAIAQIRQRLLENLRSRLNNTRTH